jgi:hypothetical protein
LSHDQITTPKTRFPILKMRLAYGHDRDEAVTRVQALAVRVIAERLEHREAPAEFLNVTFQAA